MVVGGRELAADQRVAQIPLLVVAMLAGVVLFAIVATFLQFTGSAGSGPTPPSGVQMGPRTLLLVLGVVTLSASAMYFVFGGMAKAQALRAWERRTDDEQGQAALAQTLFVSTIVRAAIAEGPGLLGAVVILLEGEILAWAAVAWCAFLLLALVPARSRLESLREAATGVRSTPYQIVGVRERDD